MATNGTGEPARGTRVTMSATATSSSNVDTGIDTTHGCKSDPDSRPRFEMRPDTAASCFPIPSHLDTDADVERSIVVKKEESNSKRRKLKEIWQQDHDEGEESPTSHLLEVWTRGVARGNAVSPVQLVMENGESCSPLSGYEKDSKFQNVERLWSIDNGKIGRTLEDCKSERRPRDEEIEIEHKNSDDEYDQADDNDDITVNSSWSSKKENKLNRKRKHNKNLAWFQRLDELNEFRLKYGHTNVPVKYPENPSLGSWVHGQRGQLKLYDSGKPSSLSEEKVQFLERIGFERGPKADLWYKRYGELKAFRDKFGHCNVRQGNSESPVLATWVKNQRCRRDDIASDRIDLLNQIGFVWSVKRARPPKEEK